MIASISGRSLSESAPAGVAMKPNPAAARMAATVRERRRCGITVLPRRSRSELLWFIVYDVVGLNPTGGTGGKTLLRAERKLPRGANIAAIKGGLCRIKIGVRLIALARVGDREFPIAD